MVLGLVDRMSGPAQAMQGNLEHLAAAVKHLESAADALRKSEVGTGDHSENAGRRAKKSAWNTLKAGATFGAAAGLASSAVHTFGRLVHAVPHLGMEMTRFAVEAASFKRNTIAGFELVEGSAEKAQDVFRQVKALTNQTPFEEKDVMKMFGMLRGSDFNMRQAQDILAGAFDVGAVVGGYEGKDATHRLVDPLIKIRAEGRMTLDSLREISLASGGKLSTERFYEQLVVMKKISVLQAKQAVHTGKLGYEDSITAVLKTIQAVVDRGGPLGKATAKFGVLSWEGQLSTFHSRLVSIFENVDIQPLVDVMTHVNELLSESSPTGQKVRGFLNHVLGGFFEGFGKLLENGTFERVLCAIGSGFEIIGAIVKAVWPPLQIVIGAVREGLTSAFVMVTPWLAKAGEAFGHLSQPGSGIVRVLGWVGKGIAIIVIGLSIFAALTAASAVALFALKAAFAAAVVAAVTAIVHFVASIPTFLSDLAQSALNLGTAFIDGWINGVTAGWDRVTGTVKRLALGAVDTVKDVLGISSPSRVVAEMGFHTGHGFSIGLEGATSRVTRSMTEMVAPPTLDSSPWRAPTPTRSIGSFIDRSASAVNVGPIHIHGVDADNAEPLAAALGPALEQKLVDVFERLSLEVGASAA